MAGRFSGIPLRRSAIIAFIMQESKKAFLYDESPVRKKDGAKLPRFTTCLPIRTGSNGLICFPITEDSVRTYSPCATGINLSSALLCFPPCSSEVIFAVYLLIPASTLSGSL